MENSGEARELEPWEIVVRDHSSENMVVEMLQRCQFLTERKCAMQALRNLNYPIDSIKSYFDHADERAEHKLNRLPK